MDNKKENAYLYTEYYDEFPTSDVSNGCMFTIFLIIALVFMSIGAFLFWII